MANQSGSHRATITADLSSFVNFQISMRSGLNRQVQAAMADIEAAVLNSSQGPGIEVSVSLNYEIRSVDTQANPPDHLAGGSQIDMRQQTARLNGFFDRLAGPRQTDMSQDRARLNVDIDDSDSESDVGEWEIGNLAIGDPVGGNDRPATRHTLFEQARPPLHSFITDLLLELPVAELDDQSRDDCPVCHESFPEVGELDEPIVLECGHVMGFSCMENWICGGHNSCPLCRAAVFRPAVLAELADQEEFHGRPRPTFRTQVPYVERNDREARTQPHRQQEIHTELASQERLASDRLQQMTEISERMWEINERVRAQNSEEEPRSISRVQAHLEELREINERLGAITTR